jgi:hypothetical protein
MENCSKQAQGNFDGMCKSHFKESRIDLKETTIDILPSTVPPPPSGQSVYDFVIPASLAFQPNGEELMPLVAHLKQGFDENRPRGWHRNDERRARGLWPVTKAAMQLQGWERELVWMEICILSGNNQASFRHLARAWGRDKGFHMVLAQFICERRGNVERKRRPRSGPKSEGEEEEEFMDDIFTLEDMELPIEVLDAMRNEHSSEHSEGLYLSSEGQHRDDSSEDTDTEVIHSVELDIQSRCHQLHAHAGMMYDHAWDVPKPDAVAHYQGMLHEQVLAEQQRDVPIQRDEVYSHEVQQLTHHQETTHEQVLTQQQAHIPIQRDEVQSNELQQLTHHQETTHEQVPTEQQTRVPIQRDEVHSHELQQLTHHQETMHEEVSMEQQADVPIQLDEVHSHEVQQQTTEPGTVHEQDKVAHEPEVDQEAQQPVSHDESQDDDFVDPLDLHLLMPHANDVNDHESFQQQPVQDPQATQ